MDNIESVKQAVRDSIKEELGSYKMPKEQHYEDHRWVAQQREWQIEIKKWSVKSLIGLMITAMGGLIYLGFVLFGRINFK